MRHHSRAEETQPQVVKKLVDGADALLQDDERVEVVEVNVLDVVRVVVVGDNVLDVPRAHVDRPGEAAPAERPVQRRALHQRVVGGVVQRVAHEIPREEADARDAPVGVRGQHGVGAVHHREEGRRAEGEVVVGHLVGALRLTLEVLPDHQLDVLVEGVGRRRHRQGLLFLRALLHDLVPVERLQQKLAVDEDVVGLEESGDVGPLGRAEHELAAGMHRDERLEVVLPAVDDPHVCPVVLRERVDHPQLPLQVPREQDGQGRDGQGRQDQAPVGHVRPEDGVQVGEDRLVERPRCTENCRHHHDD
mmetsp:Transcript_5644/g.15217  ORF Transcript_5644/g.15217 Transcript_5644/m.15217 type:complete len:305 (+) Transcript_5644:871-1785(+)